MTECEGQQQAKKVIASCDQEAWIKARLNAVIRMALTLERNSWCEADRCIWRDALAGIVNGAAVEIIRTLGLEPEFVNLRWNKYNDSV